jgi:hypothetical protein
MKLFDEIQALAPRFKRALFRFEGKDGSLGPFTYEEDTLEPVYTFYAEDGGNDGDAEWCVNSSTGAFEFIEGHESVLNQGYKESGQHEVGPAIAEILNRHTAAISEKLFGSPFMFTGGNSIPDGLLLLSVVPVKSPETIETSEGEKFLLTPDFRGLEAVFTSKFRASNAVEVA